MHNILKKQFFIFIFFAHSIASAAAIDIAETYNEIKSGKTQTIECKNGLINLSMKIYPQKNSVFTEYEYTFLPTNEVFNSAGILNNDPLSNVDIKGFERTHKMVFKRTEGNGEEQLLILRLGRRKSMDNTGFSTYVEGFLEKVSDGCSSGNGGCSSSTRRFVVENCNLK